MRDLEGRGLKGKRGIFGSVGKMETMVSLEWGGEEGKEAFTGSVAGLVYRWKDARLLATLAAHTGPVFSIFPLQIVADPLPSRTAASESMRCGQGYLTGGKDGSVALWDADFTNCVRRYEVSQALLEEGPPASLRLAKLNR